MSYRIIQANTPINRSDFPIGALFFFDFDGVLATQDEEKMFRLPAGEGERALLDPIAYTHSVETNIYPDTRYLRHLVFQSYQGDAPVEPHRAMLAFAQQLSNDAEPYFIVTARSGFGAVRRVVKFLDRHYLDPQEVFCLGRAGKADLFDKLRADWPDRPFVFFEDSKHHIDACRALNDPLMHVVEVQWPSCTAVAEALLDEMYEWGCRD